MRTRFGQLETKKEAEEKSFLNFDFNIKSIKQDDEKYFHIEGYASTFNDLDRGGDIIQPGAFKKSIAEFKPMFLWSHDHGKLIGVIDEISEDVKGLFIKARCPRDDTYVSGHVIPQVEIGSVKSMSIGYFAIDFEYDSDTEVRILKEIKLFEISLVPLPMNPNADITSAKTLDIDIAKKIKTKRDFEKTLRDCGVSQKAAVYLATFFQPKDSSDSNSELKDLIAGLNELNNITQKLKDV